MTKDQRETKDWLRAIASHMGLSLSELALKSGMAASTITRFVNDTTNKTSITQSRLEMIAAYSGFRPHQFPGRTRSGHQDPDTLPVGEDSEPQPEWVLVAIKAAQKDRNGVSAWIMKGAALEGAGVIPGDIVIIDHNRKPKPGDVVIASVLDFNSGRTEHVMRLWQPPFIMTHSFRLGSQRPEQVDEERISISGTAIGKISAYH